MFLLPYSTGSCADYGQWLKADRGIKDERTTIAAESREQLLRLLERLGDKNVSEIQRGRDRRFRRRGNIYFPA
jgi:hypothetical protein